jgi:hypothetical protein
LGEPPLFSAGAAVAEVRMLAKMMKKSFEETILIHCLRAACCLEMKRMRDSQVVYSRYSSGC